MDSSISEFGHIHCCKWGFSQKSITECQNSVDPDETACYEPSDLDLHCLQSYLYWSVGMKGFSTNDNYSKWHFEIHLFFFSFFFQRN